MRNDRSRTITIILGAGSFALIAAFAAFSIAVGPEALVGMIGERNGYLIAFSIAAVGGFSLLSAAGLAATLISLSAGGLDPFLLGAVAGAGLTLGDSAYFYAATAGRAALPEGAARRRAEQFAEWLSRKPWYFVPFATYIYIGLTPLPNELLAISLALAKVRYRLVVPSLLLGNITLATGISLLGVFDPRHLFL